jgi:hypothetical protein
MQTLERYLEALRTQDWESLASCLAEDVERTGPYLDVVRGKQPYVDFLSGILPSLRNYELKVSRIRKVGGGSALVELVEALDADGVRKEFPEALLFDFDEEGLIRRVDIYMKQPPPAGGSRSEP